MMHRLFSFALHFYIHVRHLPRIPVDTCVPAAFMTFVGLVAGLTGALSQNPGLWGLS